MRVGRSREFGGGEVFTVVSDTSVTMAGVVSEEGQICEVFASVCEGPQGEREETGNLCVLTVVSETSVTIAGVVSEVQVYKLSRLAWMLRREDLTHQRVLTVVSDTSVMIVGGEMGVGVGSVSERQICELLRISMESLSRDWKSGMYLQSWEWCKCWCESKHVIHEPIVSIAFHLKT